MKKFLILVSIALLFSCEDEVILSTTKEFTSFSFLVQNNPELTTDIVLEINENTLTGTIPHGVNITSLVATFEHSGAQVSVANTPQESDITSNNFKQILTYKITSEEGSTATYQVDLTYFTGLPILYVYTDTGEEILSKEDYLTGTSTLYGGRNFEDFTENMKIRGKGHSSWAFPKKSYQLKFTEKKEVMGMPEDKKWILTANYSDKTMLRNKTAFELGELSSLDWTPKSEFAELFVNDIYRGTYQITQKVEESENRVNITNDGFLIEIDQLPRLDEDDVYFESSIHTLLFNIKEPNLDFGDDEFIYIKGFIDELESVLYGDNFADPINGYAKYLDIDSFVDWYLINEIAKNNDAIFYSSVYMNLIPGEKLKMGPIWDFDIGFGNINYNNNDIPEGFWIKNSKWIVRLFQDPVFVEKVKLRFAFFKENKNTIYEKITANASYLNIAQQENDAKWNTLGIYIWPNNMVFDTYEEEVDYLKQWLDTRFDWLETAIDDL